ncbi:MULTISPECIES: hypothetical protein [unclassified Sphingomonas]|uniref:hypothetical protein n=1 Tax=Novosphingobium rhizosphaerae TaxID=1551649 RepID=UPI0015CC1E10
MDSMRGFADGPAHVGLFGNGDPDDDLQDGDLPDGYLDDLTEPLPPLLGADERRMQVRAYNFWASMLGDARLPLAGPLLAGHLPDFADHSVLLHFDAGLEEGGLEDPAIAYVGSALLADCEDAGPLLRLSQVPGRSILSRITDHYMQIVANEAPIGFEAEFANQRGRTILYRGILLPFSTSGDTLDYIYGVINWKELADQATTNELMAEIGLVLGEKKPRRKAVTALRPDHGGAGHAAPDLPLPAFADPALRGDGDGEESWGALADSLGQWADGPLRARDPHDLSPDDASQPAGLDALDLGDIALEILPALDPLAAGNLAPLRDEREPESLADWLASARAMADLAVGSEDRTRQALYAAIGRAWDFALAAEAEPEDFAALVAGAGLAMQARAPLIPVVKLVFGAQHDKTRLTEYATALAHAHRLGLSRGELGAFLAQTPGGLKGVVAAERRLRRAEEGQARIDPRAALEASLRTLPPRSLDDIPADGREFSLVMVRRMPDGRLAVLGEVLDDEPLLERAARRLMN